MGGLVDVPPIVSARGRNSIIVNAVFWFLAFVFLCLRLYTNVRIRRLVTASDYLCIAAFIFYTPLGIIIILGSIYGGVGFHQMDINPGYGSNIFKLTLIGETAYPISLSLTKMSICYLLSTIFPMKPFRIACLILAILAGCWAIITILVGYLICKPVSYSWDPQDGGSCGNTVAAWTFIGAFDVIVDAGIFVLPFPMLAKLKMRLGRKLAISSVFIVAATTIFIGIIRTVGVSQSYIPDFTYTGYLTYVWTGIEPPIAIMVACMMTLRPLFLVCWPKIGHVCGLGGDDDLEFESYTYPNNAASRYRHGRSYQSRRTQQPLDSNTQGSNVQTFLDVEEHLEEHHSDDGTVTGATSMSSNSMASTPAKAKLKNGARTPEMKELARKESIPEHEIFAMGATPALEPTAVNLHAAAPMFSMGATPALDANEGKRKKRNGG